MKRITGFLAASAAVLALNGCGGGGTSYDDLTTLFLVDENGDPYPGILYQCDSMSYAVATPANGEFSFYEGENCTFDFYGYDGTDPANLPNDLIYIVDNADGGKNDIPYKCKYFNVGSLNYTYDDGIWDGAFDYDYDDTCVFYL